MFTKERVNEILAVCDKATEGPWEAIDIPGDVTFVYAKRPILVSDENICIDCSLSDADFIALARTVLPQLAQRVLELEGEVDPYWMNKAQELDTENAKLRAVAEAAEELYYMITNFGDFRNGNSYNGIDEGEVMAGKAIAKFEQALAAAGYGGEGNDSSNSDKYRE